MSYIDRSIDMYVCLRIYEIIKRVQYEHLHVKRRKGNTVISLVIGGTKVNESHW